MEPIRYERDDEGIVTLTLDAESSTNLLDEAMCRAFKRAVDRAIDDPGVLGAIIVSAKAQFMAGADLARIFEWLERPPEAFFGDVLRRMERCGKPFVAVLGGTALGGGAELALACHYRVASYNDTARFGFPEVTLGLMPGAGGTQRLPRLVGLERALRLLLEGTQITFRQALEAGIVDALVSPAEAVKVAKEWIRREGSDPIQPWDRATFRIPGGDVQSVKGQELFTSANALVHKKTFGNYPAPPAILASVYHGAQLSLDAGLCVERRYFESLLRTSQAKAMVQTLFFSLKRANKLHRRPVTIPPSKIGKVGVLGAGMMGAGIAFVTANSGARVVLIDREQELANIGKAKSATILSERVKEGVTSDGERTATLDRIEATTSYRSLTDADLVIEAVFENREIKADVTRLAEDAIPPDAVYASNTSTLPITSLAEASSRPGQFIGIHFLSPVERMPLVEIILGRQTGDAALALALDYVRMIGKTPIVVNDRRGFFTSRVFNSYVREGVVCLKDGILPALIENAGRMAGMAVAPLAVADEVSMSLGVRIIQQARADEGDAYVPQPGDDVFELMVRKLNRPGKKEGQGFYEYPKGARKYLWPGLADHFSILRRQPDVAEIKKRLLYAQSLEAARAFGEGVIESSADGDVASILGWGFPPYTGGVFSLVESVGAARFVSECDELALRFGPRFEPPPVLREMAQRGCRFDDLSHVIA